MHVAEKKAVTLKLPIYISHYSRVINSFTCERKKSNNIDKKKARNRKQKIGNRTQNTENRPKNGKHKTGNRKTKN